MRNFIIISFIFLATSVTFSSCKKKGVEPGGTRLEITVVNELGELQSGAAIKIYRTSNDYNYDTNVVKTADTGNDGKALFENLENIKYYYDIVKGNMNNWNTTQQTPAPLTPDIKTSITVMIK